MANILPFFRRLVVSRSAGLVRPPSLNATQRFYSVESSTPPPSSEPPSLATSADGPQVEEVKDLITANLSFFEKFALDAPEADRLISQFSATPGELKIVTPEERVYRFLHGDDALIPSTSPLFTPEELKREMRYLFPTPKKDDIYREKPKSQSQRAVPLENFGQGDLYQSRPEQAGFFYRTVCVL